MRREGESRAVEGRGGLVIGCFYNLVRLTSGPRVETIEAKEENGSRKKSI